MRNCEANDNGQFLLELVIKTQAYTWIMFSKLGRFIRENALGNKDI